MGQFKLEKDRTANRFLIYLSPQFSLTISEGALDRSRVVLDTRNVKAPEGDAMTKP